MTQLNRFYIDALKKEFPFLATWEPEIHGSERPVTFEVAGGLDEKIVWGLEYGRRNNEQDSDYTNGYTRAWISNGEDLKDIWLSEGVNGPADILQNDTKFVLVKYVFCSMLVRNNPGYVKYTLYKRASKTVEAIELSAAQSASLAQQRLDTKGEQANYGQISWQGETPENLSYCVVAQESEDKEIILAKALTREQAIRMSDDINALLRGE